VQAVRIHDPDRRPASWSEIIRPDQFVAFATPSDGSCLLFDSLEEARACCEQAVASDPEKRFDLFDAAGRAESPLLTIVHPSRALRLDTHPTGMHRRRVAGWILIAAGSGLVAWTYVMFSDIRAIFPGVVGFNLLFAGGRFLWFNLGVRETERARESRLEAARDRGRPPA
jgi:hypothetical protein